MLKRQRRQSRADPTTAKSKITDFFQQNTAETNDGIVELVCRVDPGGSEVEPQDRELPSPAYDNMLRRMCGRTSCDNRDMIRNTHSKILATPVIYIY